jgi:RND superfamily putative drug exporter
VACDALLVRMTAVPAVLALAGRKAWYLPRWLDRLLPNLDVEGAALRDPHPAAQPPVRELAG